MKYITNGSLIFTFFYDVVGATVVDVSRLLSCSRSLRFCFQLFVGNISVLLIFISACFCWFTFTTLLLFFCFCNSLCLNSYYIVYMNFSVFFFFSFVFLLYFDLLCNCLVLFDSLVESNIFLFFEKKKPNQQPFLFLFLFFLKLLSDQHLLFYCWHQMIFVAIFCTWF